MQYSKFVAQSDFGLFVWFGGAAPAPAHSRPGAGKSPTPTTIVGIYTMPQLLSLGTLRSILAHLLTDSLPYDISFSTLRTSLLFE